MYICILNQNNMEKKIGKYLIKIEQDENAESPREWDNLGKMVCFHGRYNLGDKHEWDDNDYNGWEEMKQAINRNVDIAVILPLYLYSHSGLTMNTTGFSCRFDSGQVGWIFISKEKVREEYNVKRISKKLLERIEKCLVSEVKTYDQYLTGDVYGYQIFEVSECELGHTHEKELDSCWGFYGEDECLGAAEGVVEYYRQPKQLELNLP